VSGEGAGAPAVSVVLPTFERRALVAEAVGSALAQSLADLEVVVVDDGSTDGTAEDLRERYAGDTRLRILSQPNGGTASARNHGLQAARAPWIAFLDSDDLWQPGYLASQLAALCESPWADLVVGDVAYRNQERDAASLFADPQFLPPVCLQSMCGGAWALPSAIVVRSEVARAVGFSPKYEIVEDTDFLFRFHLRGHHLILNADRLAVWRRPAGEGAAAKTDARIQAEIEMAALLTAHRHLIEDPGPLDERLYHIHRSIAKRLVRKGRYREARPHLRVWSRRRPWRVRPRLYQLRSMLQPARVR
jgi:glycosyltransferase involved in cell wall biosynthesis